MAKIDQLLRALVARKANGVMLVAGEKVLLEYGEHMEPLMDKVISAEQILGLLGEILEPGKLPRVQGGLEVSFAYQLDAVGSFEGSARTSGGLLTVAIRPARIVAAAEVRETAPEEKPEFQLRKPASSAPPAEIMDRLFHIVVSRGASDLHIRVDHAPSIRVDGIMTTLHEYPVLDVELAEKMLFPLLPKRNKAQFDEISDTDFALELPRLARFRCNIFRDRAGVGAVFRQIPNTIRSAEDLGVPKAVQALCNLSKGLVVVTGPTGSGKSTTLAALVDIINAKRQEHIVTIEDPIEFVHPSKRCLVTQREVGVHTSSFRHALRAALRMDPDIVLVGEMRDLETIAIAIETAATGHLVFGTLHTSTAVQTVDRIIDQFPADRQQQIRVMLADSLKGVVAQTLLRKASGGRIAAFEVLLGNPGTSNLIREGKTYQLQLMMQTGQQSGMQLLNNVLGDYVKRGLITAEEAYMKSVDRETLMSIFEKLEVKSAFIDSIRATMPQKAKPA